MFSQFLSAIQRLALAVTLTLLVYVTAQAEDSPLQGLSTGQQLANILTRFLFDPDAFLEFIVKPENRYYLDRGTAFDQCGEAAKILNRIVASGTTSSEAEMRRQVDERLGTLGLPTMEGRPDPLGQFQVQPLFQALAVTSDLVHLAYLDGPEKFKQSETYLGVKQMNATFIKLICAFGGEVGCRQSGAQIMAAAYTQVHDMLVGSASAWCELIPPDTEPGLTECESPVLIASVNDDGQALVLADNSRWQIPDENDVEAVQAWESGESVRACQDTLLHPDRSVRVRAVRSR